MGTTVEAVNVLVYDSVAEGYDVSWAVDDANTLIASLFPDTTQLPQTAQDMVAKYVAAHFIIVAVEKGGLTSDRMGPSAQTYASNYKNAQGLGTTRFGQQALALDITGTLARISQAQSASAQFRIVGERRSWWRRY